MNEYTKSLIFELLNDYKNDLKDLIKDDIILKRDKSGDQEQLKKIIRITEYLYKVI